MGFFPSTIEAKLAGREVGMALLTHADFREVPRRWWAGFGTLRAGGHDWIGAGEFISIDGLRQPVGTNAPKTTFTLSGVDATIVQMARQASDRVKDRRIRCYIQFFEIVGPEEWKPLDAPYAIWTGRMDQMSYAADQHSGRSVTLTAESLWVNRKRPPYGFWTVMDQLARFAGDKGLEFVASLMHKVIRWPVF